MKTLLDIFEESNKEVYEVAKNEWINIIKDNTLNYIKELNNSLSSDRKIIDIENRLENEVLEAICFHREQVENALKNNIQVSDEVLKDYIGLKEKILEDKIKAIEKEKSKILLTYENMKELKINAKIMIDNYKMTLKEITNNYIICKPYRSKNKLWKISLNEKVNNFSIGWN